MTMKKLLIGLTFLLFSGTFAQGANPETFSVNAVIRQVITIANLTDLIFGTIDNVAGLYTVNATGGPHTAGVGAAAATFNIQGELGAIADISFVTNPIIINFLANTITVNLTLPGGLTTITFAGGLEGFFVGGNLTLVGGETSGTYTGTAQLQMVYQ